MSGIRASGMSLKDESDDYSFYLLTSDVERLKLELRRGSMSGAGGTGVGGPGGSGPLESGGGELTAAEIEAMGFLLNTNNLSDLDNAATARTNLGLGSLATLSIPLGVSNGGTGGITASAARTNLGLGTVAVENTPLGVTVGGTGATTAAAARTNLGLGTMSTLNHANVNQDVVIFSSKSFGIDRTNLGRAGGFLWNTEANFSDRYGFSAYASNTGANAAWKLAYQDSTTAEFMAMQFVLFAGVWEFTFSRKCNISVGLAVSGPVTITGSGGAAQEVLVAQTGSIKLGHSSGTMGFYGDAGSTRHNVPPIPAITATQTANTVYDATEQNMLNALKADVNNLRTAMENIQDALNDITGCGLLQEI